MCCAIWCHLYNSKTKKNTHRALLFLVKLQLYQKKTLLHGWFSLFKNCTDGTKVRKASRIVPSRRCWAQNILSTPQGDWKDDMLNKSNPLMNMVVKIQKSSFCSIFTQLLGSAIIHKVFVTNSSFHVKSCTKERVQVLVFRFSLVQIFISGRLSIRP